MLRLEGLLCTYNDRGTRQYIREALRTTTFGTRSTPLRPCVCGDLQLRWRFRLA